jgi:hypothetical protein
MHALSLAAASLLTAVTVASTATEPKRELPRAAVLTRGPGYVVHVDLGTVLGGRYRRLFLPGTARDMRKEHVYGVRAVTGVIVSHTSLPDGELKWLVVTGLVTIPTRRLSFAMSRLIGLTETESHLIAAIYSTGGFVTENDRMPWEPPPGAGLYEIECFSKLEGAHVRAYRFARDTKSAFSGERLHPYGGAVECVPADESTLPQRVPPETTGVGVLERTEGGFEVFGVRFEAHAERGLVRAGRM